MAYTSMEDVNPSIKGIEPSVTLAQANIIAGWADKIEEEGDVDSPWAVAIAQFKKAYEVEGGKWVKKEEEKEESRSTMNPIRQLFEGIRRLFEPHLERAINLGRLYEQIDSALYESEGHGFAWLHDLYLDDDGAMFAIASERGKLYRVELELSDGGDVSIGEWVPVIEEFKPVAQATRTSVIRQADGRYRWLSISCTSVLNRVGEIDSRALFDSFVAHAQETGEYPYRTFFHQGQALRTGQADFLARDDDVFITSGLYDEDNPLAEAEIAALARDGDNKWGESINYSPTGPPDMVEVAEGVTIPVYTAGVMTEVSFLPSDKAAAWLTTIRAQEVMRMRQDVLQALVDLFDGDEDKANEFAALVDGTNREISEAEMVRREGETETPDPEPQPDPEPVEREVVLDDAAMDLIAQHFAGLLAPFTEKLEGLEQKMTELASVQADAVDEARQAREALGVRLKVVEAIDAEKQRKWLVDMPRRETLTITRPREANVSDGEPDEDQEDKVSTLLDEKIPKY